MTKTTVLNFTTEEEAKKYVDSVNENHEFLTASYKETSTGYAAIISWESASDMLDLNVDMELINKYDLKEREV